ncbi:outer membrane beta-barrel protein [Segetibacter koreensis]|uniref:outer membrane beta-barrel protein n=1 Tax=Segetibacter koreensis TaxID=398037 RepID=UPI000360894A|nr:outer membrane beta-barrel protein [Segetibacter koreensis]
MVLKKKFLLVVFSLFFFTYSKAQIEVAHLTSKGFSATGFGGFLNVAIPVTEGSSVTAEAGYYSFKDKPNENQVLLVPFLLGYRYTLNGSGSGFYFEPTAGYSIGATDIQKDVVIDGKFAEQKAGGITTGLGTGYIFPGRIAFNLGLQYKRVFVAGDPALNVFSFRISHSLSYRKRED